MKTVEIKVEQGILRGEVTESKLIFKGVPYAKPPIGNLRLVLRRHLIVGWVLGMLWNIVKSVHNLRHRIRSIVKSFITMNNIRILK